MKGKKIYIIRHGQTDYNKQGIAQGRGVDTSINEEGEKQARAFYNAYKHLKFDRIYTSTLQRTIQSVRHFTDQGIPHTALPGLDEINWGVREGTYFYEGGINYSQKMAEAWKQGDIHVSIEGGESPVDVQMRQKCALEYIMERDEEQCILICMHGRAMRIFLSLLLQTNLSEMDQYAHGNLCLYKLVNNGKNDFILEVVNEQSHLIYS